MISVVGEALVDLVERVPGGPPEALPGGSPANVAVGLARLGVPVELVTRLGTDDYGALLLDHLKGNGVVLAPGTDSAYPTSTALARLDATGAASYQFEITWAPGPLELRPGTECVHTGSLATLLSPGRDDVVALLERADLAGVAVSYDPNARPALTADPAAAAADVLAVARLATVVKMSADDVAFLFPGSGHVEIAARLLGEGRTELVVITLGADGAFAATAAERVRVAAPKVDVVDTIGAGDAFTAGLLDALRRRGLLTAGHRALGELDAETLGAIVRDAALIAAITCARPGADPPTRAEADSWAWPKPVASGPS